MPANTSPDNIEYPVSTDPVAPLETVFANMANSVQDAFDGFRTDWDDFEDNRAIQTFRWANATERGAQAGMVAGDTGYQIDTAMEYRYTGSAWITTTRIFCSLNKTAGQTLTTAATDYAILWDNEIADPWGMHDNSLNNTRITVPVAGVYRIRYFVYQNISSGYTSAYARVNGSAVVQGSLDRRNAAPSVGGLAIQTVDVQLTAGDYVEIMTSHSSSNGVALVGSLTSSGSCQASVDLLMAI